MKRPSLLRQHLEGVSWRVLDEYRELIREMIRGQAGVYALYYRNKLYYVGLASNLMGRIQQHLRDRHGGQWDRFSVYLTENSQHIKELESLLLRIVNPAGNKQGGRFAGSQNLVPLLHRSMSEIDADRRASLIGGNLAKRRKKRRASSATGADALKGAVDRSTRLIGARDGWEYSATLRRDGTIRYGGSIYDSPSAAAKAALGLARCNGWSFWHIRNADGEWVRLRDHW